MPIQSYVCKGNDEVNPVTRVLKINQMTKLTTKTMILRQRRDKVEDSRFSNYLLDKSGKRF